MKSARRISVVVPRRGGARPCSRLLRTAATTRPARAGSARSTPAAAMGYVDSTARREVAQEIHRHRSARGPHQRRRMVFLRYGDDIVTVTPLPERQPDRDRRLPRRLPPPSGPTSDPWPDPDSASSAAGAPATASDARPAVHPSRTPFRRHVPKKGNPVTEIFESTGTALLYGLVGLVVMAVGFIALDLVTPGKLSTWCGRTATAAPQSCSPARPSPSASSSEQSIRASESEQGLGYGLLSTLLYGLAGVLVMTVVLHRRSRDPRADGRRRARRPRRPPASRRLGPGQPCTSARPSWSAPPSPNSHPSERHHPWTATPPQPPTAPRPSGTPGGLVSCCCSPSSSARPAASSTNWR